MNMPDSNKRIVFVAHEFGMFKGRGGVASYLYYLVKGMLQMTKKLEVYVIAIAVDQKCELLLEKRFHLNTIRPDNLNSQGLQVLDVLKDIRPDYVEVSEYLALCLEAIQYRESGGKELANTVFVTVNHTASRECFEWSTKLPLELAPYPLREAYVREKTQIMLCDLNIFPSVFLQKYVKKRYGINHTDLLRYTYENVYHSKKETTELIEKKYDLMGYKERFVVSYISRIEGRKNQLVLVNEFIKFLEKTGKDAILILAGNSTENQVLHVDQREMVYSRIPREYLPRIKFFDFVDGEMYSLICAVSNVTVMASNYENFPFAMMEYVYQGIPIMASRYSGCVDYMGEYENITSFDPFLENDLSEKLGLFAALSLEEQENIAKAQMNCLKALCEPKISVPKKLSCYEELQRKRKQKKFIDEKNYSFISCDMLHKKVKAVDNIESISNLFLYVNEDDDFCKEIIHTYRNFLDRVTGEESLVAFGGHIADYDVIGSLINNKIIFINGLKITKDSNEEILGSVLAKEIYKREDRYTYVPIEPKKGEERKRTEKQKEIGQGYKVLLDEIFYLKNGVDMKEVYSET